MNQSTLHLQLPRFAAALCAMSMPPVSAVCDEPKLGTKPDDAPKFDIQLDSNSPTRQRPTTQRLRREHGLIVGHTRYQEVGGPQHKHPRTVTLN